MKKFNYILLFILVITTNIFTTKTFAAQDSLSINGKGMFIWQLWTSNGGGKNLNAVISKLKSVGATWVVIKMADGDSYYNSPNHSLYNWASANYKNMDSVVAIFHANGIKLLAFQYVYGVPHHWGNPASETDVANSILSVKGIDGLIIDAEVQYDTLSSRVAAASAYCDSIHAHHPDAFIGLTAWARITGHNSFPWTTFLERVDVNMPQTYWAARPTTPNNELELMNSQFASYTKIWLSLGDTAADKPIMPIGQGEYFGYSNDVKQGDVATFCSLCQSTYKYPGISLWEYNQITHDYVWNEYAAAWQITDVSDKPNSLLKYNLSQNYPNPFNPVTNIRFTIAHSGFVSLKVYNLLGQQVTTIVNGQLRSGVYTKQWNGSDFSSGVYFYSLKTGNFTETKKFILMK